MKSMKNLPLSLLALAGLLLTAACTSDDDLLSASESEELCTLTFNVCTNGSVSTRSDDTSTSSSSISDGTTATKLYYGVYAVTATSTTDDDGNSTSTTSYTLASSISNIEGSTPTWTDLATTVNISLAKGNSYAIVFWAESEDSPYKLDFESETPTMTYSSTSELVANSDDYDAFYAVYETGTVTGDASVDVDLTRPFAQINFGTDDLLSYNSSVTSDLAYTKVTVSGVYTTLNLLTGEATGDTSSDGTSTSLTFGYSAYPNSSDADTGTFPYQPSDESTTYDYLAMCYVLLGADAVTADAVTLYYSSSTSDEDNHSLQVTSVPLQRNYRTNIYGSLLTGSYSMNVSKASDYYSANNVAYVSTADELTEAVTTGAQTIILTASVSEVTSLTLSESTEEIDLNDNTWSGTSFTVKGSTYIHDGTIALSDTYSFLVDKANASVTLENVTLTPATGSYGVVLGLSGSEEGSEEATAISATIKDCTINVTGTYGTGILIQGKASGHQVNVENTTITHEWFGISQNPNASSTVTVTDCTITGKYTGIMIGSNSDDITTNTLTVNGGTITSTDETPIEVINTDLTVTGAKLISQATPQIYYGPSTSGSNSQGFGIMLAGHTSGTAFKGEVTLSNITYSLTATTGPAGTGSAWNVCKYDGSTTTTTSTGQTHYGVQVSDDGAVTTNTTE